jgi:hypothetical protein
MAVTTTLYSASSNAVKYLEQGLQNLKDAAIVVNKDTTLEASTSALVAKVAEYDQNNAITISRILSYSSTFNEMIRTQLSNMDVANRYNQVTSLFDSIREDTRKQVILAESGKVSIFDKLGLWFGDFRRGSVAKRFNNIKNIYSDVSSALKDQLDREQVILDSYQSFRLSMKEAELAAYEIFQAIDAKREEAKQLMDSANNAVNSSTDDGSEKAALVLARDKAVISYKKLDKDYQIAKDLAENLKVSYNTSEVVFARIEQASNVKERIFQQSVMFFSTNETVFTGLTSAFVVFSGLNEGTNTLNAMKDGMNKGLEDLATIGNTSLERGIQAGYGATIDAKSVKMLLDAVVDYQANSIKLINEARKSATENANEIERLTNEGKSRFIELSNKVVTA